MEPEAALRQLARQSGLDLRKVGARSYVLVAKAAQKPLRRAPVARRILPAPVEPEEAPQEVIVTASKRDTLSQRFAGQWSRIDGDDLSRHGVSGTNAIEARSVGFSSTHLGAGRNKLFIRGIADSSFSGPTQSPVGQYFGDMRTGYSGPDPDLRLVDMGGVEILEGPQGTLYGSGALGGIVLLKPNTPRPGQWQGRVATGLSSTRHGDFGFDLSGMVNAPVGEGAALRIVGYHATEGGYIDNLLTGENDVNGLRIDGGRATFTAELVPDWQVDVAGVGQRIEGDDSQYADEGGLDRTSRMEQPFESDYGLASLVVRKDGGPLRFRSTTGASFQDVIENFDASTPDTALGLRQRSKARAVSNETRLWRPMRDGFSWLVGFSTIAHRYSVARQFVEDGTASDSSGFENRVRETTLYGEVGVALTERVEASAGLRYTTSTIEGEGSNLSPLAFASLRQEDAKRTEKRLLPSGSLLVRPFDGLALYARYQQGFRPGGLSIANDTVRLFRNDLLGTAEAGFRFGRPRSDRVDLQGSVTWSRWRDIQADFLDGSGLPVTDNIGDGRVVSATINGGFKLSDEWRVEAGAAWNDGKVTQPTMEYRALVESVLASPAGTMRIPNIARVVARVGLDWARGLGGGRAIDAELYARYVGRSRLGIGPHLGEDQGDYVDSALSVRLTQPGYALSLSVTNLTDEVGNRFAFGAPVIEGPNQITPLRPRTLRIGFERSF
ncbi:TonB-dependent receptor [Sphingomonas rhizophila]|uniref:TonB-dependent receptor n=1 Tax=Sphingomonas rhizophila TaxID=2071607 RepID=A0A7G9SBS8_9SPHN|nr:TonB-dependent receptor [Sphingomonas rhizophila]QNN65303.1 TonB-dependent receptor [Sphingomonas rhizophila]